MCREQGLALVPGNRRLILFFGIGIYKEVSISITGTALKIRPSTLKSHQYQKKITELRFIYKFSHFFNFIKFEKHSGIKFQRKI
jgi:hypothetical protein